MGGVTGEGRGREGVVMGRGAWPAERGVAGRGAWSVERGVAGGEGRGRGETLIGGSEARRASLGSVPEDWEMGVSPSVPSWVNMDFMSPVAPLEVPSPGSETAGGPGGRHQKHHHHPPPPHP
ncbi:unnamed protein product [Gadus morhua 'NCC']